MCSNVPTFICVRACKISHACSGTAAKLTYQMAALEKYNIIKYGHICSYSAFYRALSVDAAETAAAAVVVVRIRCLFGV